MTHWKPALVVLAILAGACANGATEPDVPDVGTVETPPTTMEAETVETTTTVVPDTPSTETPDTEQGEPVTTTTTPTEPSDSTDGTQEPDPPVTVTTVPADTEEPDTEPSDSTDGTQEPDPPVTVTTVPADTEEPDTEPSDSTDGTQEPDPPVTVTTVPADTEEPDTGPVEEPTDTATEEPDEPQPDRVIVWEGVDSEDKCAVAGGIWVSTRCEYWVFDDPADGPIETYWHPALMDDAYHAVDPATVDADHSESLDTRGPWGTHNYHVFYHYNTLGDSQVQHESMREATRYGVRSVFVPLTDWVWFPHRYDISWSDVPNMVAVTGTYPLGEQRTLLLHTDRDQRSGRPNIELPLPLPPPIRPTTPFAEPLWLEIAEALGRDCLPVEEVWDGNGTEVTDPCTLKAIETAVDWMWRGNVELRQVAIRDGHALSDFLQETEDAHEVEGPYYKARFGYESRVNGRILIRDMKWAGNWPGASMIRLEWKNVYPHRPFTAEENEARILYYNTLVERGYDVPDHYLRDELTLLEVNLGWDDALVVRTADGTWRMSQRSFCSWYERKIMINRDKLLCPDDPTPHFPDSVFSDTNIHPPSHKFYYQNNRGNAPRDDRYLGVPPS